MVAPQRTPHARGIKCDLCKSILANMTWLDQSKPAKTLADAQNVLDLIQKHDQKQCPCMPKDIRYLFIGSTYFELHRLKMKSLDDRIYNWQHEQLLLSYKTKLENSKKKKNSDCNEYLGSRFRCKIPPQLDFMKDSSSIGKDQTGDSKIGDQTFASCLTHIKHLQSAIDHWYDAICDKQVAFNSKLALRLGLTHHVIYSCYFFKYLKIEGYQLKSVDLLVILFQIVPSVTPNAIVHANYLLIRTLLDLGSLMAAKNLMKLASKLPSAGDLSHYESILLLTLKCEMDLISSQSQKSICLRDTTLICLENVIKIKPDDKLQHYYARTLARFLLIKYIRYYRSRSKSANEFFFINRYLGAMMRRCYESSFQTKPTDSNEDSAVTIINHEWIRFAVCDLAYISFEYMANFYSMIGIPEQLEIIFNGLFNVACRNASLYWIFKLLLIGIDYDSLCHKKKDCTEKVEIMDAILVSKTTQLNETSFFWDILSIDQKIVQICMKNSCNFVDLAVLDNLKTEIEDLLTKLTEFVLNYQLIKYLSRSCVKVQAVAEHDINDKLKIIINEARKSLLTATKVQLLVLKSSRNYLESKILFRECIESCAPYVLDHQEDRILADMLLLVTKCDTKHSYLIEVMRNSPIVCHYRGPLSDYSKPKLVQHNHLDSKMSELSVIGDIPRHESNSKSENVISESVPDLRIGSLRRSRKKKVAIIEEDDIDSLSYLQRILDDLKSEKPDIELVQHYFSLVVDLPDFGDYKALNEFKFAHRLESGLFDDETMYHLFESNSAVTLRYRWMMYEEQCSNKSSSCDATNEHILSFSQDCSPCTCYENFLESIPAEWRLVNFQYLFDESDNTEHLIICRIERDSKPIIIHLERVVEDCFLITKELVNTNTTLHKLRNFVSQASQSLTWSNYGSRSECRKRIEEDMKLLLDDIENDWFGPFKFVLMGKILDQDYQVTIENLANELLDQLFNSRDSALKDLLRSFLEGAPVLSREEFCLGISAILCEDETRARSTRLAQECFKLWTKTMEKFIDCKYPGHNKSTILSNLPKGQLGLILNDDTQEIPFETLPTMRILRQPIFRIPSLRIFYILRKNHERKTDANNSCCLLAESTELSFILDPENNLSRTKQRFEDKLLSVSKWTGIISKPPDSDKLKSWLSKKDIYLFIGHGAGTTYYNRLSEGHGLATIDVGPVAVVMGCSSGRLLSEGGSLEKHGICWNFISRGCPSYIGLLWDVTDADIDKFLDSMMTKWTKLWKPNNNDPLLSSTEAVAASRHVCQSSCLVGSAPIVYGLPVKLTR